MPIKTKSSVTGISAMSGGGNGAGPLDWEDAPVEFNRRNAIVNVYGDTGTGRTRLALTMPGPIGLAHTAEKVDGIVQQFSRDKQIRMVNFGGVFEGSPQQIADKAGPLWNNMAGKWANAVDDWARTTILDTDYESWEILRLARFGELNPQGRLDNMYGPVNAEFRSLFKRVRNQERCSMVAIGVTKAEYKDVIKNGKKVGEPTGRTVRTGFKEIPIMCDVVIRTSRTPDGGFCATVEKGWWNAPLEGMEFFNEDCRLPYILSVLTETEEEEWL